MSKATRNISPSLGLDLHKFRRKKKAKICSRICHNLLYSDSRQQLFNRKLRETGSIFCPHKVNNAIHTDFGAILNLSRNFSRT